MPVLKTRSDTLALVMEGVERGGERGDAARPPAGRIRRRRFAKEQTEIVEPVPRQREDRLEEQMLEEIVAPDVDDERDLRPHGGDVGEVLVRSDADVCAAVRSEER